MLTSPNPPVVLTQATYSSIAIIASACAREHPRFLVSLEVSYGSPVGELLEVQ